MSRGRIALLSLLAAAGVLLLATGVGVLALLRSETVLRWGIDQAAPHLPCRLQTDAVSGPLAGPIRVGHLECGNAEFLVVAEGVELVWSPLDLLRRHLRVERVRVAALSISVLKPSERPPTLPASLALPITAEVARLELDRVRWTAGGRAVALGPVIAGLQADGDKHRITLQRLTSPWGELTGSAELGTGAPFELRADAHATSTALPGWPAQADGTVTGPLEDLQVALSGSVGPVALRAGASLAPFGPTPLRAFRIAAARLDLRALSPALPATTLDLELAGSGLADGTLASTLKAGNPGPAPWDKGGLPVAGVDAEVRLEPSGTLVLDRIRAALDPAGSLEGSARLTAAGIDLDLTTSALDLAGLHSTLRPTRLAGKVAVRLEQQRQSFRLALAQKDLSARADGSLTGGLLSLDSLALQARDALFEGAGTLRLDGARDFGLSGRLRGFDPARFGRFPPARLEGEASARGSLSPEWQARLDFRIAGSRFRDQPLDGTGTLAVSARRLERADVSLRLGGNRLHLRGALGLPQDRLSFDLDAPVLQRVAADLSGRLRAAGTVGGTLAQPLVEGMAEATNLGIGPLKAGTLSARVALTPGPDPAVALDARAGRVSMAGRNLDAITLAADGTRGRHSLRAAARGPDVDLHLVAEGGLDAQARSWTGTVREFGNRGPHEISLAQPVTVQAGADRLRLGRAEFAIGGGTLRLEDTQWEDGRWLTRGSFAGLQPGRWLAGQPQLQSTLRLGGRWDLRLGDALEGQAEVAREGGDLAILGQDAPLWLGVNTLGARVTATRGQLDGSAVLRARDAQLDARASTALRRTSAGWALPADAPLSVRADGRVTSIAALVAFFNRAVLADGALELSVRGDGSIADPRLTGSLQGSALRLEHFESGVLLRDGSLQARFDGRSIVLDALRMAAGAGVFAAKGSASRIEGKPVLDLAWEARQLAAVQHPDLRLVVSGQGRIAARDGRAELSGALTCDQGRVELRPASAPGLDSDVVVAGARRGGPGIASRDIRSRVDFSLDLGPDFQVHGRGLDARLTGRLTLAGPGDASVAARGAIEVARGRFEAYGQRLDIDKGILHFLGPVDNPGLEIRALRRNLPVQAGVEVSGTARAPRARLVSVPEVPDSEKLSWLVLGQPVPTTGTSEAERVQAAAVALAAGLGTAPFQQQLARAVGLDEVRLGTRAAAGSTDASGVIAAGKRIGNRIYLTYEKSLSTAEDLVRVSYQLTRNWSVRTESSTTDAVDLLYTLSFD